MEKPGVATSFVYTSPPRVFAAEIVGAHEFDGLKTVILDGSDAGSPPIALTVEAAASLARMLRMAVKTARHE